MKKQKVESKVPPNKVPPLKLPKTLLALRNLYSRLFKRLEKEQGCKVKSVGIYHYNDPPQKVRILKEVIMLLWRLVHTPLES